LGFTQGVVDILAIMPQWIRNNRWDPPYLAAYAPAISYLGEPDREFREQYCGEVVTRPTAGDLNCSPGSVGVEIQAEKLKPKAIRH
jgi:hypothetical protein